MKTLKRKGLLKVITALVAVFVMLPLTAFASTLSGAVSTGMSITTSNAGSDTTQKIHVVLDFDKDIMVLPGANSDLKVALNGTVYPDERVNVSVDPVDSSKLKIDIDLNFALMAGKLTIEPKNATGISKIVNLGDSSPLQWSNISCYVPNGVGLETVSSVIGNSTNNINSKIIKRVSSLGNVRGMVHVQFLKNGVAVQGGEPTRGESVVVHYHNYLTMTGSDFATAAASSLTTAFGSNYTFTANGDQIIAESKTAVDGDELDIRIYAYPVDQQ